MSFGRRFDWCVVPYTLLLISRQRHKYFSHDQCDLKKNNNFQRIIILIVCSILVCLGSGLTNPTWVTVLWINFSWKYKLNQNHYRFLFIFHHLTSSVRTRTNNFISSFLYTNCNTSHASHNHTVTCDCVHVRDIQNVM